MRRQLPERTSAKKYRSSRFSSKPASGGSDRVNPMYMAATNHGVGAGLATSASGRPSGATVSGATAQMSSGTSAVRARTFSTERTTSGLTNASHFTLAPSTRAPALHAAEYPALVGMRRTRAPAAVAISAELSLELLSTTTTWVEPSRRWGRRAFRWDAESRETTTTPTRPVAPACPLASLPSPGRAGNGLLTDWVSRAGAIPT